MPLSELQFSFFTAVATGNLKKVEEMLEIGGAELGVADEDGNTAMHIAAQHFHSNMIKKLSESGFSVSARNAHGWTPMYIVSSGVRDNSDVIKELVEQNADLNIASNSGWTPLLVAIREGHFQTVQTLVRYGADPTISLDTNSVLTTPLELAFRLDHIEIFTYLVNQGVDILIDEKFNSQLLNIPVINRFCANTIFELTSDREMLRMVSVVKLMSRSYDFIEHLNSCTSSDEIEAAATVDCQTNAIMYAVVSQKMKETCYSFRCKLFKYTWQVLLKSSLVVMRRDDVPCSELVHLHIELTCLFLDKTMLRDLCYLRLSCKSNHLRGRFPVTCLSRYHELESYMIESWLAYGASCKVTTAALLCFLD